MFYFPAGGASVHHLAAPGAMTLARLTRRDGSYRMHLMAGEFESYDDETNETMMRQSTYEWPHAFARLDAPAEDFLARFGANHIHAIPGDHRRRAARHLRATRPRAGRVHPPMTGLLVGVDIGTASSKGVLVGPDGTDRRAR